MRRALLGAAVALLSLSLTLPAAAADKGKPPDLKGAQRRANAAAAKFAAAQSALATAERDVAELQLRNTEVKAKVGELEAKMKRAAVRQYVEGDRTLTWLSTDDITRAGRARTMLEVVTQTDTDSLDGYRAAREDLDDSQAALDRQVGDRRNAVAQLKADRSKAAAEVQKLAKLVAEFEANQRAEAAKRGRASRQVSSAAPKAGVAPKAVKPGTPRSIAVSGPWACPVQGPRAFSNDWGQPRSGGRRHQGTDILAPRGTPVVAPVGGTARAHNSARGGKSFYLTGEDGNTYFGTHLDTNGASGRVSAGTVLGTVGNSGNASGGPPHLHFEIHPGGGGPVNPYPTLAQFC